MITPATLKYLQMSGRVRKLQGTLASLLDVKPIIAVRDGLLEAGERVRTRSKALHHLVDYIQEHTRSATAVNLAVIHARAPEDGQHLLDLARRVLPVREVLIADLVARWSCMAGRGSLAWERIRSEARRSQAARGQSPDRRTIPRQWRHRL